MKVSILVPVYNERYLIGECLRRVVAAPLPAGLEREIIVVDVEPDPEHVTLVRFTNDDAAAPL